MALTTAMLNSQGKHDLKKNVFPYKEPQTLAHSGKRVILKIWKHCFIWLYSHWQHPTMTTTVQNNACHNVTHIIFFEIQWFGTNMYCTVHTDLNSTLYLNSNLLATLCLFLKWTFVCMVIRLTVLDWHLEHLLSMIMFLNLLLVNTNIWIDVNRGEASIRSIWLYEETAEHFKHWFNWFDLIINM